MIGDVALVDIDEDNQRAGFRIAIYDCTYRQHGYGILNLLYQLYLFFNHLGIISTELLHLGMLLNSQHALAYFWIDILYGLCLIGIGLVATSIWHRFGVLKMLVGATVCILMIITWLAVGDGSSVFSSKRRISGLWAEK